MTRRDNRLFHPYVCARNQIIPRAGAIDRIAAQNTDCAWLNTPGKPLEERPRYTIIP